MSFKLFQWVSEGFRGCSRGSKEEPGVSERFGGVSGRIRGLEGFQGIIDKTCM